MECAQLEVTNGGDAEPETVTIPGLYSAMDPGIYLNIYNVLSNYTVPGKRTVSQPKRCIDLTTFPCIGPTVFTC